MPIPDGARPLAAQRGAREWPPRRRDRRFLFCARRRVITSRRVFALLMSLEWQRSRSRCRGASRRFSRSPEAADRVSTSGGPTCARSPNQCDSLGPLLVHSAVELPASQGTREIGPAIAAVATGDQAAAERAGYDGACAVLERSGCQRAVKVFRNEVGRAEGHSSDRAPESRFRSTRCAKVSSSRAEMLRLDGTRRQCPTHFFCRRPPRCGGDGALCSQVRNIGEACNRQPLPRHSRWPTSSPHVTDRCL